MENKGVPLLSVCMITYNHAPYIRQAIEGVLKQIVNFEWEFIIADDCSTDGTRAIVIEYAEKYPQFIKPLLQEKNIGGAKNWMDLLAAPIGKYISYFEGDDYWTDPLKLQKQVDYLEANAECAITSHNVWVNTEDKNGLLINSTEWLGQERKPIHTLMDIIRYGSGGATCSLVFRSSVFPLPSFFLILGGADVALQMLLTSKGYMYYFKEPMGVYRKNTGSVTLKQDIVKVYRDMGLRPHLVMKKFMGKSYYDDFDFHIYDYYLPNLMKAATQQKNRILFFKYWLWHKWLKLTFRLKKN